jgi:predicted branched-subunit amino acid permease
MTSRAATNRTGWRDGVIAVSPILVGVVPFGLVFGVAAADSVIGGGVGYASSIIVFAGAAQLATVDLMNAGAATLVVIATALIINARMLMYSAALAPTFKDFPPLSRLLLPYLLTDQAFAVSIARYADVADPVYRRHFYTGAAAALWVTWQITTIIGVAVGAQVPDSWSLDYAVPLMFLALLVPMLTTRPALVAAVVGGGIATIAHAAPYHTGLMIGALAGVAAGVAAERITA